MQENNKLKFAFWGTPDVASETLQILITAGLTPSIIITNPDRAKGRGLETTPTPVKMLATKYNIRVLTPEKIDNELIKILQDLEIDLSIVVAYGSILPESIINLPKYGTLNIHYSLLPKYRGASPVESALLNGDTKTGVTIQKMIKKLDAGDIIANREIIISEIISKIELRKNLIELGAHLLIQILPDYINGIISPIPQKEEFVSYSGKIKKEDGLIDINGDGILNYNKYRAFEGWPGTYFFHDGKRFKITKAHLNNGQFVIDKVIPEGKKETIWK